MLIPHLFPLNSIERKYEYLQTKTSVNNNTYYYIVTKYNLETYQCLRLKLKINKITSTKRGECNFRGSQSV